MKRILLLTLLLIAAALPVSAGDTVLLSGSIGIPAGGHWRVPFEVKRGDRVEGWFRVARHDVECFIMDQQNYELFEKGYDPFVLYQSGRVAAGNIRPPVRPSVAGTYYLVFSNKYSILTSKTINGFIRLRS